MKRYLVVWGLVVALLCLSAPPIAFAEAPPSGAPNVINLNEEPGLKEGMLATRDNQRYAVQVRARNARLFVRVNDIPIFFRLFRGAETVDIQFNEWLKRGLNIVQISAEKFDDATASSLNYNVYYQSPSQLVTGEKFVLFSSPAEVSLPIRQPIGFRAQTVPVLRIWQSDALDFSREEQARLVETINGFRVRLIEAVGKADNAFLATYDKLLRDEIARAYGRAPEGDQDVMNRRRDIAQTLKNEINAELQSTPILKSSELDFESVGNGRLVRVARLDGRPLIEVTRGTLRFVIDKPIYGRIGGVWEMLRP